MIPCYVPRVRLYFRGRRRAVQADLSHRYRPRFERAQSPTKAAIVASVAVTTGAQPLASYGIQALVEQYVRAVLRSMSVFELILVPGGPTSATATGPGLEDDRRWRAASRVSKLGRSIYGRALVRLGYTSWSRRAVAIDAEDTVAVLRRSRSSSYIELGNNFNSTRARRSWRPKQNETDRLLQRVLPLLDLASVATLRPALCSCLQWHGGGWCSGEIPHCGSVGSGCHICEPASSGI